MVAILKKRGMKKGGLERPTMELSQNKEKRGKTGIG
jgi:hypothetical protein